MPTYRIDRETFNFIIQAIREYSTIFKHDNDSYYKAANYIADTIENDLTDMDYGDYITFILE